MNEGENILVIGYGNPGRGDDGLGPALAEAIEALRLPGVSVESDYQLSVEHAEPAARCAVVVFVDAVCEGAGPFWMRAVEPGRSSPGFSSHHVDPATVLALARDLFDGRARGYLLGIRGYTFDPFAAGLSEPAQQGLRAATGGLAAVIRSGRFGPCPTENFPQHVEQPARGRG